MGRAVRLMGQISEILQRSLKNKPSPASGTIPEEADQFLRKAIGNSGFLCKICVH
jgi:hypothetical protein